MIRKSIIAFIFIIFSGVVALEDTIKMWQETDSDSSLSLIDSEEENSEEPTEEESLEDLFEEFYSSQFELLSSSEINQKQHKWLCFNDNLHSNYYVDILIPPPETV